MIIKIATTTSLWQNPAPGNKPHLQFRLNYAIKDLKVEYISRHSGNGEGDVKKGYLYPAQLVAKMTPEVDWHPQLYP